MDFHDYETNLSLQAVDPPVFMMEIFLASGVFQRDGTYQKIIKNEFWAKVPENMKCSK